MNPDDPADVKRLADAMYESRQRLKPFRELRKSMITEMVGKNYSDDGTKDRRPMNVLALAVGIYSHKLISANPRVSCKARVPGLKASALEREIATNDLIRRIKLQDQLQMGVVDALFCMGIMKVGLCSYREGFLDTQYRPFASTIDLDDWVHDMYVKRYDQIGFSGHRYRIPLRQALEAPYFSAEMKEKLKPTPKRTTNEGGDVQAAAISQGESVLDVEELEDHVELWETWLPEHGLIVTLDSSEDRGVGTNVLGKLKWDGARSGPYKSLFFQRVPSQSMPLPPVANWRDLHDEINELTNKCFRQANRQKSLAIGQKGDGVDAEQVKNAADGDFLLLNNPQTAAEISFGGPSGPNLALALQLRQLFSYFAGNLDSLGGLMAQAETATQEEMIGAQTAESIAKMQQSVADWVKDICSDLSVWELSDPLLNRPLTKTLPGTSIEHQFTLTPDLLEGRFEDYDIEIEPYSYVYKTPSKKLGELVGILNMTQPYLPFIQQQGGMLDFKQVLEDIARFGDLPELNHWFVFTGAPAMGEEEGGGMPSNTTRKYERTSKPGQNMAGREQALISGLMTGNGDADAASLMRQAG